MSQVTAVRHTGLVVRDLEQSLMFYRDFLGLEEVSRNKETGDYIEKLVGIKGAELCWVKLRSSSGSLIELLQYLVPASNAGKVENSPSDTLGCSHVAFTVQSLEVVMQGPLQRGLSTVSPPLPSPDGKVKVLYCHDPDGILLELVEENHE